MVYACPFGVIVQLKLGLGIAVRIQIGIGLNGVARIHETGALGPGGEGEIAAGVCENVCTAHQDGVGHLGKLPACEVIMLLEILAHQKTNAAYGRRGHAGTTGNRNGIVSIGRDDAAANAGNLRLQGQLIGGTPAGEGGNLVPVGPGHPIGVHIHRIGDDGRGHVIAIEVRHAHNRNGVFVMGGVRDGKLAAACCGGVQNHTHCAMVRGNLRLFVDADCITELGQDQLPSHIHVVILRFQTVLEDHILVIPPAEDIAKAVCKGRLVRESIFIVIGANAEAQAVQRAAETGQIAAVVRACHRHGCIKGGRHVDRADVRIRCKAQVIVPEALQSAVGVISRCHTDIQAGVQSAVEHGSDFGIGSDRAAACAEASRHPRQGEWHPPARP